MAIDYTEEIESVKEHYADLLIMQYHSKYKARETVKAGAEMYLGDGVVFQLQDVLDIDEAVGKQLDIIGKILDCPRTIPGLFVDVDFFTFEKENALGFSTVGEPSKGYFKDLNYDYRSFYSLLDDDYRTLLKFKAVANRAIASWKELDDLFFNLFGDAIKIINNKDLTITYEIVQSQMTNAIQACIQLGYFEPPLGIGYTIEYV